MKMTIKMPDVNSLSDIQLVEKVAALGVAARELKLYRVQLSKELDVRQGKRQEPNMGSNPVTVDLKAATIQSKAQR